VPGSAGNERISERGVGWVRIPLVTFSPYNLFFCCFVGFWALGPKLLFTPRDSCCLHPHCFIYFYLLIIYLFYFQCHLILFIFTLFICYILCLTNIKNTKNMQCLFICIHFLYVKNTKKYVVYNLSMFKFKRMGDRLLTSCY
jgi:hypothetical protein